MFAKDEQNQEARSMDQEPTGKLKSRVLGVCIAIGLALSPPLWAQDLTDAVDAETTPAEDGDPGGNDGGEVPAVPRAGLTAPRDADPEFEEALQGYREAFERYAIAIQDYQATIESLVQTEFERRIAAINATYDPQIRAAEAVERQRRQETIETLESFLADYQADPDHTPDALFRLALLYDQQENDQYLEATRQYFELMDQSSDSDDLPDPPRRSYEKSQALFTTLIEEWGDYRGIDLAYYFMAHIEWEQGNGDRARDYAAELIRRHPDSEFVSHAWLMIGEFFFEDAEKDGPDHIRDNLLLALEAFQEAGSEHGRQNLTDANYIRAIYSWAWSNFRLEDYPAAIETFKQVIQTVDEAEERTGEKRDLLREDAVKHLAEILAIEDWDLDGVAPLDDTVMNRIEAHLSDGEPYERDVLVMLGEELFTFLRFEESIEVFEYLLESFPLHPENPKIHSRVVVALHRDYREEAAFAVRREMLDYYGKGSAWYAHQQRVGNENAIRHAENLVRDYLLMAATWYHENAQNTRNEAVMRRDSAMVSLAEEQYAMAADAYREFLHQFPNDREIYQWNFNFAECLYYSGQYDEAFQQYQVVRELDIPDNPFQEASAFNAIKALEYVIRGQINSGELTSRALAGADMDDSREAADSLGQERDFDDERAMQAITIEGEPIPPIVYDYVTAMDRYVVLQLENAQDPVLDGKFAFTAARVFYDFRHNDEARRRFAWIVENYPEHEVAYLAGSLILESFRQENDYASLTEWAEKLVEVIRGEQAEAVRAEVREYRLRAMFRGAEEAYQSDDLEAAAAEFVRMAREAPEHDLAARALNNAASAYEALGRYDEASKYYEELFREYPDHDLSIRAVYRVAVNAEWLFDYEKALRHYRLFYDRFSGPSPEILEQMGFDIESNREEALLLVAQFQEYLQRYDQAAQTFTEFRRTYPNSEFSAEILWAIAGAQEKAGNIEAMITTLRSYIDQYGRYPEYAQQAMVARSRILAVYEERNDDRRVMAEYRAILADFERWSQEDSMPAGEAQMREIAARAKFMLVEREFATWDNLALDGNLRQQQRALPQILEGVEALTARYREVLTFRNLDWSLAAYFRIGNLLQRTSEKLYEAHIPFDEGSDEFYYYQDQLDEIAFPLEDAALARYEEALQQARDNEVVNEWTRRTLEALNSFDAANYPLFKEEMRPRTNQIRLGIPRLSDQDYKMRTHRKDWGELDAEEASLNSGPGAGDQGDES